MSCLVCVTVPLIHHRQQSTVRRYALGYAGLGCEPASRDSRSCVCNEAAERASEHGGWSCACGVRDAVARNGSARAAHGAWPCLSMRRPHSWRRLKAHIVLTDTHTTELN